MSDYSDEEECYFHSKFFEALQSFNDEEMKPALEILHAILCSTDILDWNDKMELVVDKRTVRGTHIVDLVQYLLYPESMELSKPRGLEEFVKGLLKIGLESDWIENEAISKQLDDIVSSEESDEDMESEEENDDEDQEEEKDLR